MVPIQGGSFTVGEKDEFLTAPRNNETRTLTVSSFYMDKYEITNMNWNEYLHWLDIVFGPVAPEIVDTTICMITHDESISKKADMIIRIEDGRLET